MASGVMNFYQILGAPRQSSAAELKVAYREKAKLYHPDKNPGQESVAKERFIALQLAYDCLADPARREAYDRHLADRERAPRGMVGVRRRSAAELRQDAALLRAVRMGDAALAEQLIEQGAWARATGPDGLPALHVAVSLGHGDIALLLLAWGADVNAKDNDGRTALHHAEGHRHYFELADMLISSGAPLSAVDGRGLTPLHQAARRGGERVVSRMLSGGADVLSRDEDGRTALHHAVLSGSVGSVQALLSAKARPGERDKKGLSPMSLASQAEHVELVQLFSRLGVRV